MRRSLKSQISNLKSQEGQALLIVVLIMVVGLTVGLAVTSRSITNVRISTEEENSQRAFSAAEAGLERIIKQGCTPTPPGSGECVSIKEPFGSNVNSRFDTTIVSVKGSAILINGGNIVAKDDGVDVWLVPHNTDGTPNYSGLWWEGKLTIYWGLLSQDCNGAESNRPAALEVVVISGSLSSPKSTRYTYDRCDTRRAANNFSNNILDASADPPINGKNFKYKIDPPIDTSNPLGNSYRAAIVRIVPLYNTTILAVKGTDGAGAPKNLESQGFRIDSKGTSGQTIRKINYYQGYPALPVEFFPYIQFSTR